MTNQVRVTVNLTSEEKAQLKEWADKDGRSLAQQGRIAIINALKMLTK